MPCALVLPPPCCYRCPFVSLLWKSEGEQLIWELVSAWCEAVSGVFSLPFPGTRNSLGSSGARLAGCSAPKRCPSRHRTVLLPTLLAVAPRQPHPLLSVPFGSAGSKCHSAPRWLQLSHEVCSLQKSMSLFFFPSNVELLNLWEVWEMMWLLLAKPEPVSLRLTK